MNDKRLSHDSSLSEENRKFIIKIQNFETQNLGYLNIFKFLNNPKLNIFDIKDLYSSKELVKITKNRELFNSEIDIFSYTLNNKFLESNDVKFLESLSNLSVSSKLSKKKSIKIIDIPPQFKHIDFYKLVILLLNNKALVKHSIFQFCDIFTLARISLVNKHFNEIIYKYCDLQKQVQYLCEAIFKWNGLHKHYDSKLREYYKNSHAEMLNKRPRVFFTGVYTEKLNNIIGIKEKNLTRMFNSEEKKKLFRILYFLPNGDVFSIVVRHDDYHNIYEMLKNQKNYNIEIFKFRYEFDNNDNLILFIDGNYFNNSNFIYKTHSQSIYVNEKQANIFENPNKGYFTASFKIRKGFEYPKINIHSLEMTSFNYHYKYYESLSEIKLSFEFSKILRYRSITALRNSAKLVPITE